MNETYQKHKMISCSLEIDITTPGALPEIPLEDLSAELKETLSRLEEGFSALDREMQDVNAPVDMSTYIIRKEALHSSAIAGIHSTLDELLDESESPEAKKIAALEGAYHYGIKSLERLPLSSRLLKDMHSVLMHGEAGLSDFRRHQIYFGDEGRGLSEATFIPAAPEDLADLMSEFETYLNGRGETPDLIRLALSFYQLETIKPFAEGNGPMARALILLFLLDKSIIRLPLFEISHVLLKHEHELQRELSDARSATSFDQWLSFFLGLLMEALESSTLSLKQLKFFFEDNPHGKG